MPGYGFDRIARIAWRPVRGDDLAYLAAIESQVQETPWTIGNFRDSCVAGHEVCVGESEGRILAYGVLMLTPWEAQLLNLAVAPDARRLGLGRALLRRFSADARHRGAEQMILEVRRSNLAAVRLYESEGFARIGVRRAYYQAAAAEGGREDALVMRRDLSAGESAVVAVGAEL